MQALIEFVAKIVAPMQRQFINFVRIAICIVMVWIGGLKVCQYEADGIAHFVANSPFMSYLYKNGSNLVENDKGQLVKEYTLYKNPEGKMVAKNIEWHKANGTYTASYIIGAMIVTIGLLTLSGIWSPTFGMMGGLLTFGMSIVTLSFLITTPETWVPNLGGDFPTPAYGFPYLSGAGRLIVKDIIMMAGGLTAAAECATRILAKKKFLA
ncbi:YkgB family protein [Pasteurellaceae bacterium TAE3-ERU1]|nr:YkgB family protein [Pasteurellaceae bacterium TAE3-ERU1]